MAWKKYAKRYARKAVRAGIRYAKKRYMRKGNLNVSKIARDVYKLKTIVNSERKRITTNVVEQSVGQINATSASTWVASNYSVDITPSPTEGIQYNGRTGSSIKMSGLHLQFQVKQQSNCQAEMRLKFLIVANKAKPDTASNIATNMLQTNPFNNAIDFNSSLNPDYLADYKVLRTKVVRIAPDNYSGQLMLKDFSIGMKFGLGHHVRFDKDTANVTHGQLLLMVLADSGNMSATAYTGGSAGLTQIGANTGAYVSFINTSYYYDN